MGVFGSFGQDVVNGFLGVNTLKDFRHASKTFLSNGYELAPRYKFLFHVYFDLNKTEIPALRERYDDQTQIDLGILAKNFQLPKYNIELDEMNQYNRKRLVQKKITYDDVTVTMHDDGANLTRNLWYDYMSYYFKDSHYAFDGQDSIDNSASIQGFSYGDRDIYKNDRAISEWGFDGETGGGDAGGFGNNSTKPNFFRSIKIFGMDKKRFVCYVLINPYIKSFNHDDYDYSESAGTMTNQMTLSYETVKYYEGVIDKSGSPIDGFASPARYDKEPSSLGTAGSASSLLGQGGLLDAGTSFVSDLSKGNFLGALRTAGVTSRTLNTASVSKIIRAETPGLIKEAISSNTPRLFPTARTKPAVNTAIQVPQGKK